MSSEPLILDNDTEAAAKYELHKEQDPHTEIPAALLNPFDIKKYIETTGMICPFNEDNLKTVTYKIPLYGDIIYWENGDKKVEKLEEGEDKLFALQPNSIIYIQLSTTFRVPYYIAFRFNLKIDLVHKGLLLGTGPVVDPGFQGRIMIPIHNLTANQYILRSGDGLIWVEFTKLSPYEGNIYKPFKSLLKYTYHDYFESATRLRGVESSIPSAMNSAKEDAKKAAHTVKLLSLVSIIGAFGLIVAGLTLVANVITPTISLVETTNSKITQNKVDIKFLNDKMEKMESSDEIKNDIKSLQDQIKELQNTIEGLTKQNVKEKANPKKT